LFLFKRAYTFRKKCSGKKVRKKNCFLKKHGFSRVNNAAGGMTGYNAAGLKI